MPRAGGTFDQEPWLLEEMRTVGQVVAQVEAQRHAQRQPKAQSARR